MTEVALPNVTGRIDWLEWTEMRRQWLDDRPTGYEYGYGQGLVAVYAEHLWGLLAEEPAADPAGAPEGGLRGRAAALAAEVPHVAAAPPFRPQLGGNLAEDVRAVCGLTWRQIADVFAISERAVAGWRTQGVPPYRVEAMEALRAIGAILVGGLGPQGVCAWLTVGEPSRLQRLRGGELEAVVAEAESYRDTPAT